MTADINTKADDIEPVLTDTDVARIFRRVFGGSRYDATTREFAREVERAAIQADRASRDPSPQGDGWQPIETAPRDGTRVLLATPNGRIADGMFHARYGVWSWPYVMVEPTLWRPLPTPSIDAARSTPATEKGAQP